MDQADTDTPERGGTARPEALDTAMGWLGQAAPALAALLCIILIFISVSFGERELRRTARESVRDTLETVMGSAIQRFEAWARQKEVDVAIWSDDDQIHGSLINLFEASTRAELADAKAQVDLRMELGEWLGQRGYGGYFVLAPNGTVLASTRMELIGLPIPILDLLDRDHLMDEGAHLTLPVRAGEVGIGQSAAIETPDTLMFVVAPIAMDDEPAAGFLVFEIDPQAEANAIFQGARTGLSGETYAIDRGGRLLSESRFNDQLTDWGLLRAGQSSALTLAARDPGFQLDSPTRTLPDLVSLPLTEAARSATIGERGENLVGYRDYRGVPVIGVWAWIEHRQFGVITEMDLAEAFSGANKARAVLRVFAVAVALAFILLTVLFNAHRTIIQQRARAIEDTQQNLRRILMTAAEGIYGVDGEGRCTFINRQACQMTGFSEDEVIGRSVHSLIHHSRSDGSLFPQEECDLHGGRVASVEGRMEYYWTKSGQSFPVEVSMSRVDANDPKSGAVITFRDVSQRLRDELALRRYAQELKRSNAELQEFAYAASHDLQEPLRKIQTFGQRLSNKYAGELDESGELYIDRMVNSATRMRQLIDDLLSYSRVNTKSTAFLPVDLNTVVSEVLSDLEPRIQSLGATVRIEGLPAIEADPTQMQQLFLNLVSNALKFHRTGVKPSVSIDGSIEVGESGAVARIAVADNGIGFDPKHGERIFGMFERLHGRDEYEGTGVGLATCRKIAERHAGNLTAWGEPGAGAVFTLVLPIRQANLG